MLDYEVLDLGLVYYKNVIPEPQKILDLINSVDKRFLDKEHGSAPTAVEAWVDWSDGTQLFNWQKFFPKPEEISPNDYYYNEQMTISKTLYDSLEVAFNHYSKTLYPFASRNIKSREHSIHLLRYDEGGYLPAHSDHGVSSRNLSTVMYLNDNYEGGEIEFKHSNVRIKPDAGSVIFFPSNFLYVHEVYPITKGSRYSLPHWYHNMRNMISSTGEE
jgi:Rps23 Pro-64 3,4-dihydroxylase Tpa1-like proline 4-hydroxylase